MLAGTQQKQGAVANHLIHYFYNAFSTNNTIKEGTSVLLLLVTNGLQMDEPYKIKGNKNEKSNCSNEYDT